MALMNDGVIVRSELLQLFDRLSQERIIYVGAPAGYGKTVAVMQWLDSSGHAKVMMTFDEYDNHPAHFCERFCAALQSCQPHNGALREIVSHPSFGGASDEFALRAIASLAPGERSLLVVDDLHFITDEKVLRLLRVFLMRLPESFQIVLISRNDLPADFSDLWVKGHLSKITSEHLLFSSEEIMALYEKRGNSLTREQAESISRFTGGWAIGINALLLSGGEPTEANHMYLEQFIRQNVWEKWDEATREFMLRTWMVRELHPGLCEALTGVSGSAKLLDELTRGGAFIYQTSDGAHHYHNLFRNFLNHIAQERGDDFIRLQWEKAGHWYVAQNDFYNAMDCYIKCESHQGIAKCFGLLVSAGHEYFYIEKMLAVVRMPIIEEVAEKFPYIYSALSWAAFNEGRAQDMGRFADLYYKNQREIVQLDPRLQLNIVLVRLIDFRLSLGDLMQAPSRAFVNWATRDLQGMGVSMGIVNQNMPLLHRGTRDFSQCAIGDVELNIMGVKAALGGLFGEGAALLAECLAAGLLYEQGQLEKAYAHALAANAAIKDSSASEIKFCAMSTLVYTLDALGQPTQADAALERIYQMVEADRAYHISHNLQAMTARRHLGKGDIDAARKWLSAQGVPLTGNIDFYKLYGHLTTGRAYITLGDYDAAIILLMKVLRIADAYARPLGRIETRILLAIACSKKRTLQNDALSHLEQAVREAYEYGYTQMFISEGAEIFGMLRRLQRRAEQLGDEAAAPVSFIKMLYLKALEHHDGGLTSGQPEKRSSFTQKQKAVMALLCEGKSYREIAEMIGIKLPTLRSHLSLIYKKLDVTSETDAVMKIRRQGLLD